MIYNKKSIIQKTRNGICILSVIVATLFYTACRQSGNNGEKRSTSSEKSDSINSLTESTIASNAQKQNLPQAKEIVANQKSRVRDAYGSGQYGASRDANARTHKGIDIIVASGEKIFSPIKGNIVRQAMPYRDDSSYKGIVLKGVDEWDGYELKIFYVEGLFSGRATETQEIGSAQNLTLRYPTITNHIHLEVRYLGVLKDPFTIWNYSF